MPNGVNIGVSVRVFGKRMLKGVIGALVPAGLAGGYGRLDKEQSAGHLSVRAYRSLIQWTRKPLSLDKPLYFAEWACL